MGASLSYILALCALLSVLPAGAAGEPLRVDLVAVTSGEGGAADPLPVRLLATAVASPGGSEEPRSATTTLPGSAALDLPPGATWELRVEAGGWWAPPVYVSPRAGDPSPEPVTIRLLPTADVVGFLVPPRHSSLPEEVSVRFQAADPGARETIPRSTVPCPVDDLRRFRCRLPAGKLDLSVRAEDFVSHYFWDRELEAGERSALGTLQLVRGGSMVGWVVDEAGEPLPPEAGLTVTAVPAADVAMVRSERPGAEGRDGPGLRTAPNEDGFFQITGMVPGSWVLWLEAEGYAPTESPTVGVVGEREAELLVPLVIRRPLELVVQVDPAADEDGEPWDLVLVDRRLTRPVASGSTDDAGRWRGTDLPAGSYSVVVEDSRRRRVLEERLELDRETGVVHLAVERVEVEGEVLLGDEPLAGAGVYFGGDTGSVSMAMQADEEGRFAGWVPRAGEWRVDVRSRQPPVYRRFRGVEVEEPGNGGPSRVVLELPDTLLEGQVVDGAGQPVSSAVVMAQQVPFSEMPSSDRVDGNGRFLLRGLAPGGYRLQALGAERDGGRVHSAPVDVHLAEEAPYAEVRLVLEEPTILAGQVVSRWGGVPGAKVVARPRDVPTALLNPTLTRPDGSFRIALPPGTESADLTVQAPGYVLQLESAVPVAEGRPVTVRVDPGHGGTLRIGGVEGAGVGLQAPPVSFRHGGRSLAYSTLAEWARLHQVPTNGDVLAVPRVPSGAWSICRHSRRAGTDPVCQDFFLPPGAVEDVHLEAEPE